MNLLGAFNQSITDRAIQAMAAGDARAVGALMTEAQVRAGGGVGEGVWHVSVSVRLRFHNWSLFVLAICVNLASFHQFGEGWLLAWHCI